MTEIESAVIDAAMEWREARIAVIQEANKGMSPIPSFDRLANAEARLNQTMGEHMRAKQKAEPL